MRPKEHREDHDRVRDLLAEFAAGAAGPAERRLVNEHLVSCSACAAELAEWQAVRDGVRAAAPVVSAPGPQLVAAVLDRSGAAPASVPVPAAPDRFADPRRRVRHAVAVLFGQLPLVRRRLWLASALVMALGAAIAAAGTGDSAGLVLALVAPLVTAAGLAVVYGPDVDPGLELVAATPTSPRIVLLARLTLVFGYDLLLALVASGVLVGFGVAGGVWALISAWFGPMALLSGLSFGVSLWLGPNVAVAAAMTVWALRLLASKTIGLLPLSVAHLVEYLWSTNGITLGVALALVVAAVVFAPRVSLPAAT